MSRLNDCLLLLSLYVSVLCLVLVLMISSFAIILLRKRELVALLQLYSCCRVTAFVLWHSLVVPWVGLWSVIVASPGHTHLILKAKRGMSDVDFCLLLISFANILDPDQDKTYFLFLVGVEFNYFTKRCNKKKCKITQHAPVKYKHVVCRF